MNQPLLSIRDLRIALPKGADRLYAVRDISLDLHAGEILCVVGESGSGKSMIANAAMRLLPREVTLDSGEIHLAGKNLATLSVAEMSALRGRAIGMIFQEPMSALNPIMTVGQQICEVLEVHGERNAGKNREKSLYWLSRMGLAEPERVYRSYPFRLSGGQRQRVMIAMALVMSPRVLVADEPTTALDVTTQREILDLIRSLQREDGLGVLFITHDFGVVSELADRVVVMEQGVLIEQGTVERILRSPKENYTKSLIAAVPKPKEPSDSVDSCDKRATVMSVENVDKSFGLAGGVFRSRPLVKAVRNVSFSIRQGETVGIVGESGSGKSTLARCITRLREPDSGVIRFHGEDILAMSQKSFQKIRPRIQMIFQDPFGSLNPRRKVGEIICQGLITNGARKIDADVEMRSVLDLVGLSQSAADRYPHEFSGGQRQRIGIARALVLKPEILIADEPVSALDVRVQAEILKLLNSVKQRLKMSMVFITHDLLVASEICDRVIVMYRGEIVECGNTRQVFSNPAHDYTKRLLGAVPGRKWIFESL